MNDQNLTEKLLLVNGKTTYGFSTWYLSFIRDWLTNFHFQLNYSRELLFLPGFMPTVQLYRETFS